MQLLLATKLFIPQISDNLVLRETQLDKMISAYNRSSRFTLVCAPAGYGKTTLVLEFLHAVGKNAAWVSLDDGDNDAQRFLAYLAAAFKNSGVEIGTDLDALITDLSVGSVEDILTMLINCIAAHEEKIIIVLDDYHVIRSRKIHDILKFLTDYQPPNLHIVIISREDPDIPLARLRMKDSLTEIRMDDLLFNKEETSEFFSRMTGKKLDGHKILQVNQRTEGWIAGLLLAALLLKNYTEEQTQDFLNKFDGTNSYIIDYLLDEVLGNLAPDIREFLCRTSVLERMNGELCDELTGRFDSRELLKLLEKKNLFLIPLDDKKDWFRYHHLFADSLKTSLSREEESKLYKKASFWMKNNGFTHEAVRYAFQSKDMDLSVKMVEDSVLEMFQTAQLDSLVAWMEKLPDEKIIKSEILCVRKAIALFITGHSREALLYLESLGEEFERNASPHNRGLIYTVRAMMAGLIGKDAEPLAKEALKYLEPWDPIAITSNLNSLGRAQYRKGNYIEAAETFQKAYEAGHKIGYQFITSLALMNYSFTLEAIGEREKAITLCCRYIDGMKKVYEKLPPYIGVIYVTLADLYLRNGESDKAEAYRSEGTALCKNISYDVEASMAVFRNTEKSYPLNNDEALFATAGASAESAKALPIGEEAVCNNASAGKTVDLDYGEKLSGRETEILSLIGKGLSNREIAQALFISENTAQWHISHIYAKLGVKSRTQAVIKAKELGIIE